MRKWVMDIATQFSLPGHVVKDIVPAVRTAVSDARNAGAGVVIVVAHSGLNEPSSYDTVSTGVPSERAWAARARASRSARRWWRAPAARSW